MLETNTMQGFSSPATGTKKLRAGAGIIFKTMRRIFFEGQILNLD